MEGDHITITGNRLENNEHEIYLEDSSEHNIIVDNTISDSSYDGIILEDASNNTLCHNNLNNTRNFYDSGSDHYGVSHRSINNWDNGKEGNY